MSLASFWHQQQTKPGLALAFLLLITVLGSCSTEGPYHLYRGDIMGTTYSVQVAEHLVNPEQLQLEQSVLEILSAVDASMSTYKPDSELSRLNRLPPGEWMQISAELVEVLSLSQKINRQSQGAFDITVGPLVALWGFGPQQQKEYRREELPADSAIQQLHKQLGMDGLELDKAENLARRVRDVQLDLSAIAKGYAVDQLARHLFKLGLRNYLVEVGGELRASGKNARGRPWTVGIEKPELQRGIAFAAVQLRNKAIATSGDYRNFLTIDGKRYSHTIDPRTAWPVNHALASVSVLHDSAAAADAWATALNVLGPEQGFALAEKLGLLVFMIVRDDENTYLTRESAAFSAYNQNTVTD